MDIKISLVAEAAVIKMRFGSEFTKGMKEYRNSLVSIERAEAFLNAAGPGVPKATIDNSKRTVKQQTALMRKAVRDMIKSAQDAATAKGKKLKRADIIQAIEERAKTPSVRDALKRAAAEGRTAARKLAKPPARKHPDTARGRGRARNDARGRRNDSIDIAEAAINHGIRDREDTKENRQSMVDIINEHAGTEYKLSDFSSAAKRQKILDSMDKRSKAAIGKKLKAHYNR